MDYLVSAGTTNPRIIKAESRKKALEIYNNLNLSEFEVGTVIGYYGKRGASSEIKWRNISTLNNKVFDNLAKEAEQDLANYNESINADLGNN